MSVLSQSEQVLVQRLLDEVAGLTITLSNGKKIKVRGFKSFATESRVLRGVTDKGESVDIWLDEIDIVDWPDP